MGKIALRNSISWVKFMDQNRSIKNRYDLNETEIKNIKEKNRRLSNQVVRLVIENTEEGMESSFIIPLETEQNQMKSALD